MSTRAAAETIARAARAALCAALFVASAIAVSCGGGGGGGGNLLDNGGFEDGKDGWSSLTDDTWFPSFDLSDIARTGTQSAQLRMRGGETEKPTLIHGIIQEVTPEAWPRELVARYRVDGWERATPKQYVQVIVMAWGADNVPDRQFPNHQIRYILAGITAPPFEIRNARYIFAGPPEPQQGEWIEFRRDIRQDFIDQWGAVPEGFDKIRVMFEVRFDDKQPADAPSADVYWDDLYLGEAAPAPDEGG